MSFVDVKNIGEYIKILNIWNLVSSELKLL